MLGKKKTKKDQKTIYNYIVNLKSISGAQLSVAAPNRVFAEAVLEMSDFSEQLYIIRKGDVCDTKYTDKQLKNQSKIINKNVKKGKFIISI